RRSPHFANTLRAMRPPTCLPRNSSAKKSIPSSTRFLRTASKASPPANGKSSRPPERRCRNGEQRGHFSIPRRRRREESLTFYFQEVRDSLRRLLRKPFELCASKISTARCCQLKLSAHDSTVFTR